MKPTLQISLLLIFLGGMAKMHGQQTTARIVDAKTSEPIPYATIQFGTNKGIITNEEGLFSLRLEEIDSEQDSLYISSIGYEKTAIALSDELDSLILIQPKPIELSGVYLFNEELDVDEIIEKVKERLPENYNSEPVKQRLFFRVSDLNRLNRLNIDFKKSTIEELNEPFIDSVVSIIPRNAAYYTESLCKYTIF